MINIDQIKALTTHLDAKWRDHTCPQCRVNTWAINGFITMISSDQIGLVIGDPVIPIIAMSCLNCGNTLFLNAIVTGVMPPGTPLVRPMNAPLMAGPSKEPAGPTNG